MRYLATLLLIGATWIASHAGAAEKTVKETLGSGGNVRTYYLFVPESAKQNAPAPLVVLLHGSGRNGKSLTDHWELLAKKAGFAIVGPDATTPTGWGVPEDGPDFLYDLVEMLRVQHDLDPRRIYLFGHSAGAIHALQMGLLESEYFAAVAVHAGALPAALLPIIERAPRKIPIAIWVGAEDRYFPLPAVRATRDALNSRGFGAQLTEIVAHTHDYYSRSRYINENAWEFLQRVQLSKEPKYERYLFPK